MEREEEEEEDERLLHGWTQNTTTKKKTDPVVNRLFFSLLFCTRTRKSVGIAASSFKRTGMYRIVKRLLLLTRGS